AAASLPPSARSICARIVSLSPEPTSIRSARSPSRYGSSSLSASRYTRYVQVPGSAFATPWPVGSNVVLPPGAAALPPLPLDPPSPPAPTVATPSDAGSGPQAATPSASAKAAAQRAVYHARRCTPGDGLGMDIRGRVTDGLGERQAR